MPAAERFGAHGVDTWHGSETASRAHRACTAHVAAVSLQQPDVNSYHTLRNAPAGASGGSSGVRWVWTNPAPLAPAIDVEFHTVLPKYCFAFLWVHLRPPDPHPGLCSSTLMDAFRRCVYKCSYLLTSVHQPSNKRRSQILDSPLYSNSWELGPVPPSEWV